MREMEVFRVLRSAILILQHVHEFDSVLVEGDQEVLAALPQLPDQGLSDEPIEVSLHPMRDELVQLEEGPLIYVE